MNAKPELSLSSRVRIASKTAFLSTSLDRFSICAELLQKHTERVK